MARNTASGENFTAKVGLIRTAGSAENPILAFPRNVAITSPTVIAEQMGRAELPPPAREDARGLNVPWITVALGVPCGTSVRLRSIHRLFDWQIDDASGRCGIGAVVISLDRVDPLEAIVAVAQPSAFMA